MIALKAVERQSSSTVVSTFGFTEKVPLELSKKNVLYYGLFNAVETIDETSGEKVLLKYKTNEEDKKREVQSIIVCLDMLSLLQDVKRAYGGIESHVKKGISLADAVAKIDIAVELEGSQNLFLWQLKSSATGFYDYIDKYGHKTIKLYPNGDTNRQYHNYPSPGCMWCNNNSNRTKLLTSLSKWLSIPISKKTYEAIEKYKILRTLSNKKKTNEFFLDGFVKHLGITTEEIQRLNKLRLLYVEGRNLILGKKQS